MEDGPFAPRGSADRVGTTLAAAREAKGITLDDVAQRTRVPRRHLELIEAGSSEGLPALTYTAGFVRSYAALVGLDGDALARQYRGEVGSPARRDTPESYEPADPARVPTRLLVIVTLLLVAAVAGGYAIWRGDGLFGGGAVERERIAAGTDPALYPPPETAAAPAPAPAAPPPATGNGPVVVTAREEVWVRIGERDGKAFFLGTMTPGQRIEVPADAIDPVLRTGRAEVLAVTVGARAIPPLGPPDTLVRAASLKRDALLAAAPVPAAGPIATPANGAPDTADR